MYHIILLGLKTIKLIVKFENNNLNYVKKLILVHFFFFDLNEEIYL